MPNWMRIALEVSGDEQQQKQFFESIGDGLASEYPINFEKIITPPDNLFRGNLGQEEKEYCRANNIPDWYSWNTANWGTKWNASYCFVDMKADSVLLLFDTAWALPIPIIEKIEQMIMDKFIDLKIYGEFIEEGYAVAGFFHIGKDGGELTEVDIDFDEQNDEPFIRFFNTDGTEFKFKNL